MTIVNWIDEKPEYCSPIIESCDIKNGYDLCKLTWAVSSVFDKCYTAFDVLTLIKSWKGKNMKFETAKNLIEKG